MYLTEHAAVAERSSAAFALAALAPTEAVLELVETHPFAVLWSLALASRKRWEPLGTWPN
jgi:hypothetical protein